MSKWLGLQYSHLFAAIIPTSTSLSALYSWECCDNFYALCSLGSIVREVQFVKLFAVVCLRCLKNKSTKVWYNLYRSNDFARKVAALVGMSQFSIAHLRKDVGAEIKRQRGGHPKLLVDWDKKLCVTLVIEGWLGTIFATPKQLQSETCKVLFDNTTRRATREDRLGA